MRTILIIVIASMFCLQGQELPVVSQKALATMEREIAIARVKAIKVLESDLQRVMKSGDLETANVINAEIDTQKRLIPILGNTTGTVMQRMAGRRVVVGHEGDPWFFKADGTLTSPGFMGGTGTWEFDAGAKKIHITCPRWSKSLDWVSEEVWIEDGRKAWNLQK